MSEEKQEIKASVGQFMLNKKRIQNLKPQAIAYMDECIEEIMPMVLDADVHKKIHPDYAVEGILIFEKDNVSLWLTTERKLLELPSDIGAIENKHFDNSVTLEHVDEKYKSLRFAKKLSDIAYKHKSASQNEADDYIKTLQHKANKAAQNASVG